ncbi:MAG: hypothetical protein M1596_03635 [Firmicutes bacterium]|jgi:hypothetical protein|nr:hypothetical protein [Bacillota bacterium]
MNDIDYDILKRVAELQRELDRIYAATLDITDPLLLAVSCEINDLVVEYLRQQPIVVEPPESLANDS